MPHDLLSPPRPIHISAKGVHPFTPEDLKDRDPPVVFALWIPTFAQRDSISQLIFAHGVMPVTQEHGRSVLLSELYEVYAPEGGDPPAVPAGKRKGDPDEMAVFLEGYWQRADIYDELVTQWALREKERLLDQLHGAEAREAEPIPPAPFLPRETARAKRIAMEMLELSESYRQLQARYADYEAREDQMLFRLFVSGWSGLETTLTRFEKGPITEACLETLREELAALEAPIARAKARQANPDQFYLEVCAEIRQLMSLDKETEKNSASPPGQGSSQSGLDAESGGLGDGSGEWTGSTIEPVPPLE